MPRPCSSRPCPVVIAQPPVTPALGTVLNLRFLDGAGGVGDIRVLHTDTGAEVLQIVPGDNFPSPLLQDLFGYVKFT
jgi:hypothetical protein